LEAEAGLLQLRASLGNIVRPIAKTRKEKGVFV
jgi:hypothetical protein